MSLVGKDLKSDLLLLTGYYCHAWTSLCPRKRRIGAAVTFTPLQPVRYKAVRKAVRTAVSEHETPLAFGLRTHSHAAPCRNSLETCQKGPLRVRHLSRSDLLFLKCLYDILYVSIS